MGVTVSGKENVVQTAIMVALHEYCRGRGLRMFQPYANQQGEALRRYCGDLFGLMENADLIALEIKELDVPTGLLKKFDAAQHKVACLFERLAVPLAYAYNTVTPHELAYYAPAQSESWAVETLGQIKRSLPTPLPGARPAVSCHQTLLDWLNGDHQTNGLELFGRTHGALRAVDDLRNGMLVLLYSVSEQTLASLPPDAVKQVIRVLRKSRLDDRGLAKLRTLLAAGADVFDGFTAPAGSAPPPRPSGTSKISEPEI
jgi:hypothetical protein